MPGGQPPASPRPAGPIPRGPHPRGPRPASRADEREAGLRPVACGRCGTAVLVAKFSPEHTSVQWGPDSAGTCAEFAGRVAAGEQAALIDGCASLRASIGAAVLAGRLEVTPP